MEQVRHDVLQLEQMPLRFTYGDGQVVTQVLLYTAESAEQPMQVSTVPEQVAHWALQRSQLLEELLGIVMPVGQDVLHELL